MPSNALGDFHIRIEEVNLLLDSGTKSRNSREASMYAKCAVVLACAALERYMNDILEESCGKFNEQTWCDLSQGRQRYLLRHLALKMDERALAFTGKNQPEQSDCQTLMNFVRVCNEALVNPSSWPYFTDFGMFGEGTNAPGKIDAVLRAFDSNGRSLYDFINGNGENLSRVLPGLSQLVQTRHATAHALKGSTPPGPTDSIEWVGCAVTMAMSVDAFLGFDR